MEMETKSRERTEICTRQSPYLLKIFFGWKVTTRATVTVVLEIGLGHTVPSVLILKFAVKIDTADRNPNAFHLDANER